MHDMPRSVREDVSMEECSNLLNNVPFVKNADSSFLRQVCVFVCLCVYVPVCVWCVCVLVLRYMMCIIHV